MKRTLLALLAFVAVCYGVGGLGGWITQSSVTTWYVDLAKPGWTPPGWVIAVVWNVLFGMTAVAGWLVWREVGLRVSVFAPYAAQLVLNVTWSALFFGMRSPGAALVEIGVLGASVAWTARRFRPHNRLAAGLLLPYVAWVGFAALLNAAVWWMNR